MPKAVLSNRIFMEADKPLIDKIRKELTYTIPNPNPQGLPITIRNMGVFKKGIITMPIGRLDLIPKGYEIVDKRVLQPAEFPEFNGELRPSQQKIYDEIEDNSMINAWVSFGKTFTALAIAGKFKQKTLVVTHTIQLREQWVREIEKVYGFTPGVIGSGRFETNTPIVVGNIQTLYKVIGKIQKTFGLVILDEFHHISAASFSRVIDKCAARYKIGLSGTMARKDGKHVVFRDYFGNNVIKPPAENYMEPEIHIYNTNFKLPHSYVWANRVTALAENESYQKVVSAIAAKYVGLGHSVLLVSDRVKFLQSCADLIGETAICITGEVTDREELMKLIERKEKKVLCGTQSMFSEGISINSLSCLILGTPLNNDPLLTQLIGRVIREQEGKLQPIVVDINLKSETAKRQAAQRAGLYLQQGWKIKRI